MNKTIEESFVNSYIIKNKRDRILFELCGKKRRDGIGRFSHCADNFLIETKVKLKGQHIAKDLQDVVAKTNSLNCYVISYSEELDGKEFNKDEILNLILGYERGAAAPHPAGEPSPAPRPGAAVLYGRAAAPGMRVPEPLLRRKERRALPSAFHPEEPNPSC